MRELLDTTVLVDVIRRYPAAIAYTDAVRAGKTPRISIATAMEVIIGCRDKHEVRATQKLLSGFDVLDLSPVIGRKAYELVTRFGKGRGLGIPDALIAATALVEGATLVTANVRHFDMIPGLPVEKPY